MFSICKFFYPIAINYFTFCMIYDKLHIQIIYIENVKNLISHIKSLELQIRGLQEVLDHKGTEKKAFNRNWQKKMQSPRIL